MSGRKASMQSSVAGLTGRLRISKHPADGVRVRIVTDRFSMLLVEVVQRHHGYNVGNQLHVATSEFEADK